MLKVDTGQGNVGWFRMFRRPLNVLHIGGSYANIQMIWVSMADTYLSFDVRSNPVGNKLASPSYSVRRGQAEKSPDVQV